MGSKHTNSPQSVSCCTHSTPPISQQEQCNGRSALHLAVDLQNLSLVRLLLRGGADPNHLSYGGFSPYHLTFGRHDDDIKNTLYPLTDPSLRELPDSEPEDSEDEGGREEEEGQTDEEVCREQMMELLTAALT